MDTIKKIYTTAIVSFLFLGFSWSPGWTQEEVVIVDGDTSPIIDSEQTASTVPLDRISNDFSSFLGDNANTVVYGLRNGDEIIIEETILHEDGTTTTTTTSIDPPTGNMGNGNVKISLGLAREELAQWGIDQPTAEELSAALVGGEITAPSGGTVQLDGVLTMRSEGMGWGQIAHEYGVKLGHVVSGIKTGKTYSEFQETDPAIVAAEENNTEQTRVKHAAKANSGKVYGEDIVSGSNETAQNRHTIKAQKQYKQTYKENGIVTGSGAAVNGSPHAATLSNTGNSGQGHAYGQGIVTATGSSVTTATNTSNAADAAKTSNSNGKALAKGHYK